MMMVKNNEKDKLIFINSCLAEGKNREDIAQRLGYRNWRGLDIFMRRKGMKWDSQRNMYYSMEDESQGKVLSKAQEIISLLGSKDADPKNIAARTGFRSHHEMAAYMKANNYVWSHDISNYILGAAKNDLNLIVRETEQSNETAACSGSQDNSGGEFDIAKYLPLLDLLFKNMEKLKTMFSEAAPTIPRYAVSGTVRTKSFYMSDRISTLISDYSHRKNISQKEIIEAAVIEFMCKYSYKDEVSKILDSNTAL